MPGSRSADRVGLGRLGKVLGEARPAAPMSHLVKAFAVIGE